MLSKESPFRVLLRIDSVGALFIRNAQTLLAWASRRGHVETIRLLLDNGADVMAGDGRMRTPLHRACTGCFEDAAKVSASSYAAYRNFPEYIALGSAHAAYRRLRSLRRNAGPDLLSPRVIFSVVSGISE